jgi:hypothetical protein
MNGVHGPLAGELIGPAVGIGARAGPSSHVSCATRRAGLSPCGTQRRLLAQLRPEFPRLSGLSAKLHATGQWELSQ